VLELRSRGGSFGSTRGSRQLKNKKSRQKWRLFL
jgi:hypothetical protein